MESEQGAWQKWAQKLQKWGLADFFASLLDGAAPVRTVMAQFVYAGAPLFASVNDSGWQNFAQMLDDPAKAKDFAHFLREEAEGGGGQP